MNIERFEKICRASKLRPEKRVQTDQGTIYIAEGYSNAHPEFPKPHYKTLWAVAKSGVDVAQPLYFEFGASLPKKEERIAKAIATAREFLNG
jgi:hypothetical protein